jgi:hypothetical protein
MRGPTASIARFLTIGFIACWFPPRQSPASSPQDSDPMSISSVSATPPAAPVVSNNTPSTPPAPSNDNDSDDSSSTQPAQAPLPPGQGTRIDQLA